MYWCDEDEAKITRSYMTLMVNLEYQASLKLIEWTLKLDGPVAYHDLEAELVRKSDLTIGRFLLCIINSCITIALDLQPRDKLLFFLHGEYKSTYR
jgi:hypothetical protein